jgi:catechol 2,3-dioxygenase-like lactoylglutathione lyase family enzyme
MFRRLDAVVLFVKDLKRSIDFYVNELGLPLRYSDDNTAELFNNPTRIVLKRRDSSNDGNVKSGILLGFTVHDLYELCEMLKKRGLRFLKEPREESFGKHAIILDPDGHMISLAEIKSTAQEEFDLLGAIGTE